MRLTIFGVLWLLIFAVACRKDFEGDRNVQVFPETYTLVDSVRRDSTNLLTTTVVANWWGESVTGFIKGYEVSIDNGQTWSFTTNQQGVYLLSLPIGVQSGNLPIYVRAIDNLDQKDPTPAIMVFPVKNTAPTIAFDFSAGRKVSSLPAFRYVFAPNDVDGLLDIQRIEIVFNDTNKTPYAMPGNTLAASFVATRLGNEVDTNFQVYINSRTTPQPQLLSGIVYNQTNTVYIRAVDRVGATSAWAVDSQLIRKPVSDFLMINDYRAAKLSVQTFYVNQLNALGAPYNTFDIINDIPTQLPSDVFTIVKVLELYKKMIWYSDDPNSTLGLAQLVTPTFFQNGGAMFLLVEMPTDFDPFSNFFSFTPVQQLVVPPVGVTLRMNINETVQPNATSGSGWPTLKATSIISNARPFVTFTSPSGTFGYDTLCTANLLAQSTSGSQPWSGLSNIMSKRIRLSTGKTDMIFATVPLNRLNGNNNMDSLWRKALIEELGF